MPISAYFKGAGKKVLSNMQAKNGKEGGKREFYATANARGMNPSDNDGDEQTAPPKPKRKSFGQQLRDRS